MKLPQLARRNLRNYRSRPQWRATRRDLIAGILAAAFAGQARASLTLTGAGKVSGAAGPVAPITSETGTGVTFGVHINPSYSTVTGSLGAKITAISDLKGGAGATDAGAGAGLWLMTEGGVKFLQGRGAEYLECASGFTSDARGFTAYVVGRPHKNASTGAFVCQGNLASRAQTNGGVKALSSSGGAGNGPLNVWFQGDTSEGLADRYSYMLGSQIQVFGGCSRTTANGGLKLAYNEQVTANRTQSVWTHTAIVGYTIGKDPWGSQTGTPGTSWNFLTGDIFEIILIAGTVTNAQDAAIRANIMTAWGVVPITKRVWLSGDSITTGNNNTTGTSIGTEMTRYGATRRLAGNIHVVNCGHDSGGSTTLATDLTTTPTLNVWSPGSQLPSAANELILMVGVNDVVTMSGKAAGALMAGLIWSNASSYLKNGITKVTVLVNIASTLARQTPTKLDELRTFIRTASGVAADSLLVACDAQVGGANEGKVVVMDIAAGITVSGATIFDEQTDSDNLTYYNAGELHPTGLGNYYLANGGDNAAYGYVAAAA